MAAEKQQNCVKFQKRMKMNEIMFKKWQLKANLHKNTLGSQFW